MILYAKSLGVSATVLGIIAGMMPLLVIFQIPAANYVSRVGYKRFVYGGWGVRVMFIFAMALVPLTGGFLNPTSRLALILFLLFGFNLSRGISSCAWLPWITSLVPGSIRGKYLALDAAFVNLASFVAFLLAGLCLGPRPAPWQFAVIFAFSAVMGLASLVFLKRIPEGETPEQARASTTSVPWLEIARYGPFRKLLRMNIAWALSYGGLGASTLVNMANTRLAMTIVRVMGRNHFFALFSVANNLSLGVAPILWGLLIDALGPLQVRWAGFEWNRFSIFFVGVGFSFLLTFALCRNLEEPEAASMEELLREILIQSPQRVWLRLWPRS